MKKYSVESCDGYIQEIPDEEDGEWYRCEDVHELRAGDKAVIEAAFEWVEEWTGRNNIIVLNDLDNKLVRAAENHPDYKGE